MMGRSVEKKYSHRVGSVNLSSSGWITSRYDLDLTKALNPSMSSNQEFDDAVGLPEHRPLGLVAGDMALDVAADITLDVRLAGEERPVDVGPVLDVLFMGHVGAAAA